MISFAFVSEELAPEFQSDFMVAEPAVGMLDKFPASIRCGRSRQAVLECPQLHLGI